MKELFLPYVVDGKERNFFFKDVEGYEKSVHSCVSYRGLMLCVSYTGDEKCFTFISYGTDPLSVTCCKPYHSEVQFDLTESDIERFLYIAYPWGD